MRRHCNEPLVQAGAKPFTNFGAECHAIDGADLTVAFARGTSHENPICQGAALIAVIAWMAGMLYLPRLFVARRTAEAGEISGGPSPDELPGCSRSNPCFADRRRGSRAKPLSSNSQ